MLRRGSLLLVTLCAVGSLGASATGMPPPTPARFWISTSGTTPSNPSAETASALKGAIHYLYVWAQPGTMVDDPFNAATNPFRQFRNISLNITTADTGIKYLDDPSEGITIYNPVVDMIGRRRFEVVSADRTPFATSESLTLTALTVRTAIGAGFGGDGCGDDPLCRLTDLGEPAWLFAKVPYKVSSIDVATNTFLQIGPSGMTHFGEMASGTDVTFGSTAAGQPTYNAGNLVDRSSNLGGDTRDLEVTGVGSAAELGDYNADGIVDVADYTLWRDTYNPAVMVTAGSGADGDKSGVIDIGDYDLWRDYFGIEYTPHMPATQAAPEPAALLVLAVGGGLFAGSRRAWARR